MTLSRRSLITGLVSFVAAPAIVRASSLMPVKAWADVAMWFPGGITLIDTAYDEHLGQVLTNVVIRGRDAYFETASQS